MFKIKLRWKRIGKFDYIANFINYDENFYIMYDTISQRFFIHDENGDILILNTEEFQSWVYRGTY